MYTLLLLNACLVNDGGKDEISCGEGTHLDGDSCVADEESDADTDTDTDSGPYDADGDGSPSSVDCNDGDASVHPGADEVWYDGIDQDCDGADDDQDRDGYLIDDDCDDADASVNPAAAEAWYDGVDQDCDGNDEDQDQDSFDLDHDCDDEDPTAWPGAPDAWYDGIDSNCAGDDDFDQDGDGVRLDMDCDDGDSTMYPGAADAWYDGIDSDCAADSDFDQDGDGFDEGDECDDFDANRSPSATEICDVSDVDENCDGAADDADGTVDVDTMSAFYADTDGDAYGDPSVYAFSCDGSAGFVANADDCNDTDASINPSFMEICDDFDVDEDCDGLSDDDDPSVDPAGLATWFQDADADGYGDATSVTTVRCSAPIGYVASATDCDDARAATNPGALEYCNIIDDDCDGDTDEAASVDATTWYLDADSDTYGTSSSSRSQCSQPVGYVSDTTDCSDSSATVNPGATETCNDVDDDCDGTVDDSAADGTVYYFDADEDGFGATTSTWISCSGPPSGYRADDTDCDDSDSTIHPYRYEDPTNGLDDDCDGLVDSTDTTVVNTGPTTDDSSATVSLSGISFPFCGSDFTRVYMISNGRLTFGSSDVDPTESVGDFATDIAIAGAWDDLNPSTGSGRTYWAEYSDAVGFYWRNVRESGATTSNTFSIVLFEDGRILLEYGAMNLSDALVGFSCGGAGTSTDFSSQMSSLTDWGLGTGLDTGLYEDFTATRALDLSNSIVRLCGNPDGSTNPCEDQ